MVITCNDVVLKGCSKCEDLLGKKFNLEKATCALSENDIYRTLKGVSVLVMGGSEKMTPQVLRKWRESAPDKDVTIIFAGNQADTSFSKAGWQFAKDNGIPVIHTGGGIEAVARSTSEEIHFKLLQSSSPFDKRILVVGAGNIGGQVIRLLKKRRYQNLLYTGGRKESAEMNKLGIPYEPDLDKAFNGVDVVTIHVPLIEGITENLIGYDHLIKIHSNGLLVNNARAAVVNPKGFLHFLKDRDDVSNIWDVFYFEGAELKKMNKALGGATFKKIYDKFEVIDLFVEYCGKINWKKLFQRFPRNLYTSHSTAFRDPTFDEYGKRILEIVEERFS